MVAIEFLTRVGQTCTPPRQEMTLLSSVLGVTALVSSLNNPVEGSATESSILGPFHTDDVEDGEPQHLFTSARPHRPPVELGGPIASEGSGEYMYVEGRVLTTDGEPIADAVVDTWESDHYGGPSTGQ